MSAEALDYSLAVIAPGQGSQKIGMGLDIPDSPGVRAVTEEADEALASSFGFQFSKFVLYGKIGSDQLGEDEAQAKLTKTEYAQPAIILDALRRAAALKDLGSYGEPGYFAGNSLGFLVAAEESGALTIPAVVRLGEGRGEAFKFAIENSPRTTMMALSLGNIDLDLIGELREKYGLEVCLKNPGQRVLGGELQNDEARDIRRALIYMRDILGEDRFKEEITSMEDMVDAAFHSRYMAKAEPMYREVVNGIPVSAPTKGRRLVGGSTVSELDTEQAVRNELVLQITQTEDWEGVTNLLRDRGVVRITELSEKPRLSAMNRRAFKGVINNWPSKELQIGFRWTAREAIPVSGGSDGIAIEEVAMWYLNTIAERIDEDVEKLNGDTKFEDIWDSEDGKWLRSQVRARWGRNVSDEEAKKMLTIGQAINATHDLVNS